MASTSTSRETEPLLAEGSARRPKLKLEIPESEAPEPRFVRHTPCDSNPTPDFQTASMNLKLTIPESKAAKPEFLHTIYREPNLTPDLETGVVYTGTFSRSPAQSAGSLRNEDMRHVQHSGIVGWNDWLHWYRNHDMTKRYPCRNFDECSCRSGTSSYNGEWPETPEFLSPMSSAVRTPLSAMSMEGQDVDEAEGATWREVFCHEVLLVVVGIACWWIWWMVRSMLVDMLP